jgi:hypothetical protein
VPWKGEFFNRRKNGDEYVEFAIVTPIRQADGSVTHYVAVKEDITEKRRVARELDEHRHHLENWSPGARPNSTRLAKRPKPPTWQKAPSSPT